MKTYLMCLLFISEGFFIFNNMDISDLYKIYESCNYEVCTDTRLIQKGSLFFALTGANFNGNHFANKAISDGCKFAVCDDKSIQGEGIVQVESSLDALQQLASFHRAKFDMPFLAITGSNGKTTTKELVSHVLNKKFDLLATSGNLNNHIGVPLTLLKLRKHHDFALIEMGANKIGDIRELCEIADPTHGMITNIGLAHIEGFGSEEGVVVTKTEMYRYIIENKGILFVNNNEDYLLQYTKDYPHVIEFGGEDLNFRFDNKSDQLGLIINDNFIATQLFGKYNANNVLTAYAVGLEFGVEENSIKEAIEGYAPNNNRSQIKRSKKGNQLILDAYNANPTSLNLAIDEFLEKEGPKIFIVGDMRELGNVSEREHKSIINKLKNTGCKVYLVGPEFMKYNSSQIKVFSTVDELIHDDELSTIKNSNILIKGSRGVQLEKVESYL